MKIIFLVSLVSQPGFCPEGCKERACRWGCRWIEFTKQTVGKIICFFLTSFHARQAILKAGNVSLYSRFRRMTPFLESRQQPAGTETIFLITTMPRHPVTSIHLTRKLYLPSHLGELRPNPGISRSGSPSEINIGNRTIVRPVHRYRGSIVFLRCDVASARYMYVAY